MHYGSSPRRSLTGVVSLGHAGLAACILLGMSACGANDAKVDSDGPPAPTGESGWSGYGYDLANSQRFDGSSELTASSVPNLALQWSIQVGAGATSTPIVVDGAVYFGAWDGYFYAADSETGELLWKAALGTQYVRSTPLVTESLIYVAVDRSLMAIQRVDGKVVFKTELTDHPQGFLESSPKLADGVIVLGVASFELNLEKENYSFDGSVVGVDATTGDLIWRVPVTGEAEGPCMGGSGVSVWSSAAIDPELGLAYIGTGQTYEAPASTCNDSLLAIHYKADHKGERVAWKATYTKEDVYVATGSGLEGLDHDIGGAPNLFAAGSVQAVGVGDKGGTYRAFNRMTGKALWRADLDTSDLAQLGGVMTTAATTEDTIFVTSNSWMAFGFITAGEHAEVDTATLYALDMETGKPRWTQALDAPVFGTFAVVGDVLFHPTIRGDIYARDVKTGEQLWKTNLGSPIGSGLSVTQDGLFASGGFSLGGDGGLSQVVRFSIDATNPSKFDARENTFKELTPNQCNEALATLQPDTACRECLCDCDASTAGACQGACWEQAPCVVEHCSMADFDGAEGMGCYTDHCSSKLLPPNVLQESYRSAACAIACTDSCNF